MSGNKWLRAKARQRYVGTSVSSFEVAAKSESVPYRAKPKTILVAVGRMSSLVASRAGKEAVGFEAAS